MAALVAATFSACAPEEPAASRPDTPAAAGEAPVLADESAAGSAEPSASLGAVLADVTAEVGVEFVHDNGGRGAFYMPESMGAGAALFDADADGDLDLYLVQGGDLTVPAEQRPADRLYRNRLETGRLTFEDVTAASGLRANGFGMGVAVGDVDGDGRDDLYVTNFGANQLWRNEGPDPSGVPRFADITARSGTGDPRWSVPALFFDLDGDGHLDLFVGNYLDFTVDRHRACMTKAGTLDFCGPEVYAPVPDRLLRGRGDGTFDDVTESRGLAAAEASRALGAVVADFDRDGALDLYVANDGSPNHLWVHGPESSLIDEAFFLGCAVNADGRSEASMGVDAEDMDGDGDLDLVVSHLDGETNTLYRNDGAYFTDVSIVSGLGAPSLASTGFGIGWLDLDLDGTLDLMVTNGAVRAIEARLTRGDPYPYRQPGRLFRGIGAGRFEPVAADVLARAAVGRGLVRGDLDNDGDLDVILTANRGPARVLLRTGSPDHWLGARPVAGVPERDVVGAEVAVISASGGAVWRRAARDGSYASSDDPRALFVLETGAPQRVVVRWPDGAHEAFDGVPAGSYTTLRRGQGEAVAAR